MLSTAAIMACGLSVGTVEITAAGGTQTAKVALDAAIIVTSLGLFCNAGHAEEVETFFATHPVPDAERTLTQTIETINACAALSAAQTPRLAAWLAR